jgi:hypothetical protein
MAKNDRITVKGNRLVETITELANREDTRRVCLYNEEKHLLDIPVDIKDPASPAAVLEAPVLAAIRAIGSLLNECTLEVEKVKKTEKVQHKK